MGTIPIPVHHRLVTSLEIEACKPMCFAWWVCYVRSCTADGRAFGVRSLRCHGVARSPFCARIAKRLCVRSCALLVPLLHIVFFVSYILLLRFHCNIVVHGVHSWLQRIRSDSEADRQVGGLGHKFSLPPYELGTWERKTKHVKPALEYEREAITTFVVAHKTTLIANEQRIVFPSSTRFGDCRAKVPKKGINMAWTPRSCLTCWGTAYQYVQRRERRYNTSAAR